MGSVEKRVRRLASGKMSTSYIARWREPGTKKERSKSFRNKTPAANFLTEVEGEKLRGEYISPDAGSATFKEYAESWLAAQTFEESTYEAVESRLRMHAFPKLGGMSLSAIKPSTVQTWLRGLGGANAYQKSIFTHVSTVFNAAVADEIIRKNPCASKAVTAPKVTLQKFKPWSVELVEAVKKGLPERFRIFVVLGVGLGLRQGEIFGLAVEDVDFDGEKVVVRRQVKTNGNGKQYFGPPKGGKEREVPLPDSVRDALRAHLRSYSAVEVELPWRRVDGQLVSANLIVTGARGQAIRRQTFNRDQWAPALAYAHIDRTRQNGTHMLRHVYASTLLHAGESIKAVSAYLGHADAAFTLKTYTHLLPASDERARSAIDAAFGGTTVEHATQDDAKDQVSGGN